MKICATNLVDVVKCVLSLFWNHASHRNVSASDLAISLIMTIAGHYEATDYESLCTRRTQRLMNAA